MSLHAGYPSVPLDRTRILDDLLCLVELAFVLRALAGRLVKRYVDPPVDAPYLI